MKYIESRDLTYNIKIFRGGIQAAYKYTYQYHKTCELDMDLDKYKQKHSKPEKMLLECGDRTGSRTFHWLRKNIRLIII